MVLQLIYSSGFQADTELDASTHLPLPHSAHYDDSKSCVIPHSSLPCLVPGAWPLVGCGDVLCVLLIFWFISFNKYLCWMRDSKQKRRSAAGSGGMTENREKAVKEGSSLISSIREMLFIACCAP